MQATPGKGTSLQEISIFTDVAMTDENVGRGTWGAVVVAKGHAVAEDCGRLPRRWSVNRAELYAVRKGLLLAGNMLRRPEHCTVQAYTDNGIAHGYLIGKWHRVSELVSLANAAHEVARHFRRVQFLKARREHLGIRRADQLAWQVMQISGRKSARRAVKARASEAKRQHARLNDPFRTPPKHPRSPSPSQQRRAFFRELARRGHGVENPPKRNKGERGGEHVTLTARTETPRRPV